MSKKFVKKQPNLDFLIGKNNGEEWISIYRGLSKKILQTTVFFKS